MIRIDRWIGNVFQDRVMFLMYSRMKLEQLIRFVLIVMMSCILIANDSDYWL